MNPGKFPVAAVEFPRATVIAINMEIKRSSSGLSPILRYTDKIVPHNSTEELYRPRAWRLKDVSGVSLESTWVSLKMRSGHSVSIYCEDRAAAEHVFETISMSL